MFLAKADRLSVGDTGSDNLILKSGRTVTVNIILLTSVSDRKIQSVSGFAAHELDVHFKSKILQD